MVSGLSALAAIARACSILFQSLLTPGLAIFVNFAHELFLEFLNYQLRLCWFVQHRQIKLEPIFRVRLIVFIMMGGVLLVLRALACHGGVMRGGWSGSSALLGFDRVRLVGVLRGHLGALGLPEFGEVKQRDVNRWLRLLAIARHLQDAVLVVEDDALVVDRVSLRGERLHRTLAVGLDRLLVLLAAGGLDRAMRAAHKVVHLRDLGFLLKLLLLLGCRFTALIKLLHLREV